MGSVGCVQDIRFSGVFQVDICPILCLENTVPNPRTFQETPVVRLKPVCSFNTKTTTSAFAVRVFPAHTNTHTHTPVCCHGNHISLRCLPSIAAPSAGNSENCPSEGTLTVLRRLRALDESVGLSWASPAAWGEGEGGRGGNIAFKCVVMLPVSYYRWQMY